MGWISDRHMKQGGSLNSNPRNNGSRGGPLRLVLGREMLHTVWVAEPGRAADWRAWSPVFASLDSGPAYERLRQERLSRNEGEVSLRSDGPLELLECGHLQSPRSDLIGPTNATRRRCRSCKREQPPHCVRVPSENPALERWVTAPDFRERR